MALPWAGCLPRVKGSSVSSFMISLLDFEKLKNCCLQNESRKRESDGQNPSRKASDQYKKLTKDEKKQLDKRAEEVCYEYNSERLTMHRLYCPQ